MAERNLSVILKPKPGVVVGDSPQSDDRQAALNNLAAKLNSHSPQSSVPLNASSPVPPSSDEPHTPET